MSSTGYSSRSTPDTPTWVLRVLARPHRVVGVRVDGRTVRYLRWGDSPGRATVFVHGGGAHAQWWSPVAAALAEHAPGPVVAMDLSGHGISDWRTSYAVAQWADEVHAVAADISSEPVNLVGHSMGGIICAQLAIRPDVALAHLVVVDAPVWADAPGPDGPVGGQRGRPPRRYRSAQEALGRFRLIPPQDCATAWYPQHVAWHGLTRGADGWRWRVDPRIFLGADEGNQIARFAGDLGDAECPVSVVMGAASYLAPASELALADRPDIDLQYLPRAQHHVMLDQPEALARTIADRLGHRDPGPEMTWAVT